MSKKDPLLQINKKIEGYFTWPLYFAVIIAVAAIVSSIYDPTMGIIFSIALILSGAVALYLVFVNRRALLKQIYDFTARLDDSSKDLFREFEIPYLLFDHATRIKWHNDAFKVLVKQDKIIHYKLTGILPTLPQVLVPFEGNQTEKMVTIEDRTYRLVIKKVEMTEVVPLDPVDQLYVAYFLDISLEHDLEKHLDEDKAVFALIYIDNYEEVIHSIEDVRRPLLVALIDRNINKLAKEIDGVLRKFEKDKYFITFQKKHLQKIQDNKFKILDVVRDINIGNEMAVTLTIGIGMHDGSYEESFENSKAAIDLALGRGGDQAVVKKNDQLYFYGGKNRGIEKSTRVKARIKAHAFRELIEECERVIIMGHKIADMDSLGAAIGVYACAKHLGKPAHIIINKVTTGVQPIYEQILSDADYPRDIFINNQDAISFVSDQVLLVVVDVSRASYTEYSELLKYIKKVVVFDHHRVAADHIDHAVLSYIEPYASSTCEMITEIIQYVSDKFKLKPIEADALFAGITVDTKNFVSKTGVKTFEAAAYLRRSGADAIRVNRLFKNDMASYKAKAAAVKDAEIYHDNIAISTCPSDIPDPNLVGAQAADELLSISGIKASFVMTKVDNIIYISARSIDDINVQMIMEKLGGGGHLSVAGAQVENSTIEKVKEGLKHIIDDYFEKGELQ